MTEQPWRRVTSKRLFHDDVLGLREDEVTTPDGSVLMRKVVEYRPAVAVAASPSPGSIILVQHYRYSVSTTLWEVPGGIIGPGEEPVQAAARELKEEAGFAAEDIQPLVTYYPEPAFTDHRIHLLRATAVPAGDALVPEPEISTCAVVALPDALSMVYSGKIASSWSMLAVFILAQQNASGGLGE